MKRKMIMMMLAVTVGLAMIAGATWAWFTADDSTGETEFTAGILEIDVNDGLDSLKIEYDLFNHMNPGDIYDEIQLVIKNTGNKNLIWFGDWIISGGESTQEGVDADLKQALYIYSATMEFLAPEGGKWDEPTDNFIEKGVGAGLYPDWYDDLAGQNRFGVVGLDVWDNNNGMGTAPYEHVGALKPGFSYRLTVRFGFHEGADNHFQGDVTEPVKISFKVDATQPKAAAIEQLHPTIGAGGAYWENWANGQLANQIP